MKKKIFPNGFKNSGLYSFGKGLIKTATGYSTAIATGKGALGTVAGVGASVVQFVAKNKDSEAGGKGKLDIWGWLGVAVGFVLLGFLVYQLFSGKITLEIFLDIINQFFNYENNETITSICSIRALWV